MSEIIKVQTPMGELIAKAGTDPMYPGIALDFIKKGQTVETPVALLECDKNSENPDGSIRLLVWGDKKQEDYTDKFIMLSSEEPIFTILENCLSINGVFVTYELEDEEIEKLKEYIDNDDYDSILKFIEDGEGIMIGNVNEVFQEIYLTEDSCSDCIWLMGLISEDKKREIILGRDDVACIGDKYIYSYVY